MHDEKTDLVKSLVYTIGVITQSKDGTLQRIADAYEEAMELVASIDLENGSARSRIIACFARHNTCKSANDAAAAGWMLAALQQRVYERNLPEWEKLAVLVDTTISLLPRPTVH